MLRAPGGLILLFFQKQKLEFMFRAFLEIGHWWKTCSRISGEFSQVLLHESSLSGLLVFLAIKTFKPKLSCPVFQVPQHMVMRLAPGGSLLPHCARDLHQSLQLILKRIIVPLSMRSFPSTRLQYR